MTAVIDKKNCKVFFSSRQFTKTKDKNSLKRGYSKCMKYDGEMKAKLMVVGKHIKALEFLHISYVYLIHR